MLAGTPPSFWFVHELVHIPSGPRILAVGSAAWTSLVIWTPPLATMPANSKQCAPCDLIVAA